MKQSKKSWSEYVNNVGLKEIASDLPDYSRVNKVPETFDALTVWSLRVTAGIVLLAILLGICTLVTLVVIGR